MHVANAQRRLVGIITELDLLHASSMSIISLSVGEIPALPAKITVEQATVQDIVSAAPGAPIEEAAILMANKAVSCLPVPEVDTSRPSRISRTCVRPVNWR